MIMIRALKNTPATHKLNIMKPTRTQKKLITTLGNNLNYWGGTNDISSPTH